MHWNEIQVGEHTGRDAKTIQRIPKWLNKMEIYWYHSRERNINRKTQKYEVFTNWCARGATTLNKNTYIKHVKQIHNGIDLPKSILNRPPLVDYVFFYYDEVEEYYAIVDPGLT